ncbi:MAG TPA: hypothetical protein VGB69_05695 [Edaphobacter sp.]
MKNPNSAIEKPDAIEKVLGGLREVSTPPGMEQRILKALEDRASTKPQPRWSWLSIPAYRTAAVCGGIALAAGVFVLTTMHFPARRPTMSRADSRQNAPQLMPQPSMQSRTEAETPQVLAPDPQSAHATSHAKARLVRSISVHAKNEEAAPEHANSYPPPPMPLTQQERLLLRIAHKDSPIELARLTTERRAALYERDKKEFEQFFALSKDGENQ